MIFGFGGQAAVAKVSRAGLGFVLSLALVLAPAQPVFAQMAADKSAPLNNQPTSSLRNIYANYYWDNNFSISAIILH